MVAGVETPLPGLGGEEEQFIEEYDGTSTCSGRTYLYEGGAKANPAHHATPSPSFPVMDGDIPDLEGEVDMPEGMMQMDPEVQEAQSKFMGALTEIMSKLSEPCQQEFAQSMQGQVRRGATLLASPYVAPAYQPPTIRATDGGQHDAGVPAGVLQGGQHRPQLRQDAGSVHTLHSPPWLSSPLAAVPCTASAGSRGHTYPDQCPAGPGLDDQPWLSLHTHPPTPTEQVLRMQADKAMRKNGRQPDPNTPYYLGATLALLFLALVGYVVWVNRVMKQAGLLDRKPKALSKKKMEKERAKEAQRKKIM